MLVNFKSICCATWICYVIKINMVYVFTKKNYTKVCCLVGTHGWSVLFTQGSSHCTAQVAGGGVPLISACPGTSLACGISHPTPATHQQIPASSVLGMALVDTEICMVARYYHANLSRHLVN